MTKLTSRESPFERDAELSRSRVHWIKPQLVAGIQFFEWTRDGKPRHPQFLGLRPDKSASEGVRERPTSATPVAQQR
jgi:ATP-dependent DNA ligase